MSPNRVKRWPLRALRVGNTQSNMGLVAQVDYHLGRVLDALESMGRMRDTLIVFTSDHGEFGGDRRLGEKELLYDEIVRVPMIVMGVDQTAFP